MDATLTPPALMMSPLLLIDSKMAGEDGAFPQPGSLGQPCIWLTAQGYTVLVSGCIYSVRRGCWQLINLIFPDVAAAHHSHQWPPTFRVCGPRWWACRYDGPSLDPERASPHRRSRRGPRWRRDPVQVPIRAITLGTYEHRRRHIEIDFRAPRYLFKTYGPGVIACIP